VYPSGRGPVLGEGKAFAHSTSKKSGIEPAPPSGEGTRKPKVLEHNNLRDIWGGGCFLEIHEMAESRLREGRSSWETLESTRLSYRREI